MCSYLYGKLMMENVLDKIIGLAPRDREALLRSPLAAGLEPAQGERLLALARPKKVGRGDFLFLPDNKAHSFYLVLEGRIKVFHIHQDGRECLFRVAGRGDILGLAVVFGSRVYPAMGEAVCGCRVLGFAGDRFMELIRDEADLGRNVLRLLALRLENTSRRQCLLRNLPAPAQVAHYLMERATECQGCCRCSLDLRPLQITAQEIGIARETLSRIIGRLKREGAIDCCRGCVTIRNYELIGEIAAQLQAGGEKNKKSA